MKIVQINTHDITGGAAKAAYRLHKGLRQIGEDCQMLVRYKFSVDNSVSRITIDKRQKNITQDFFLNKFVQDIYINNHRTDISNTLFSLPYPGYDLTHLSTLQEADIINLHWIAHYQSLTTLHRLFNTGKPVVWTLHDQWAFTGGCHYSAGCKKYCADCSRCPQLSEDPFDLPSAILKDKLELFKKANLTVVTPSRWLANCAKESQLFRNIRVEVIPNSLETDVFTPIAKREAKKCLELFEEDLTLLFGAQDGSEKRKGFSELVSAMQYCKADPKFHQLMAKNNVKILCFGYPSEELKAIDLPVVSLGYLDSDEKVRNIYAAADIFILPSSEDNLPNTMLEALSCGTPVIAFAVGGISDVVIDNENGKLAAPGNVKQLAQAILELAFNSDQRARMAQEGRKKIVAEYSLDVQAKRYLALYNDLQTSKSIWTVPSTSVNIIKQAQSHNIASENEHAYLETAIGTYFNEIYDQVLSKALKESRIETACFAEGFYDDEGGWRWINQKGNIIIPRLVFSIPSFIIFELTCGRAEYYEHFPFDVQLYISNALPYRLTFNRGDQTQKVQLRIGKIDSDIHFLIECNESFVPSHLGINNDNRQLSVHLSNLRIEPCT